MTPEVEKMDVAKIGGAPDISKTVHSTPSSSSSGGSGATGLIGGIAELGSMIGDIVISAKNYELAEKNYEQQKKQFKYSKELQEKIFEREDNAVLRRTWDLERAGLSKTLAAGSAASAGAVVPTTAPQKQGMEKIGKYNVMQMALAAMQQREDISKTQAEQRNIRAQEIRNSVEARLQRAKARIAEKEADISEQTGVLPGSSEYGKWYRDLYGVADAIAQKFKSRIIGDGKKDNPTEPKRKEVEKAGFFNDLHQWKKDRWKK